MDGKVPTFEEMMAGFAEVRVLIEKNAERAAESAAEHDKRAAEHDKRAAEYDKKFAEMREELGNIGHNNGLVAEEIVFNSLDKDMVFAGIEFDSIDKGVTREKKLPDGKRVKGEYDVVLKNGSSIAIIEVKHRVGKEALKRLIEVQLPRFKLIFPEYSDFKMYLGLGGMSFERGVAEEARSMGIATLMLSGEAVKIDDADVKAW